MTDWTDVFLGTLFPAVPLPFDDDGRPDFEALESFAAWMNKQPVDGVAVWTGVGRGSQISGDHRREVLRIWMDALEGLRFIAEVTPEPGSTSQTALSSAVEVACDAVGRADFLLVSPPTAFRDDPDRDGKIVDYHKAIAELGVPIIVSIVSPSSGGMEYSLNVITSLLEMPETAAIRTDLGDSPVLMQDLMTRVRVRCPTKAILSGEDRLYGYSLYRGCHGLVAAIGSICPRLQRELIDAWFMGDSAKFLNLSRLTDHIAEAVCIEPGEGIVQRILAALAHQGIIPPGATCDPWGLPIAPQEEELVKATLDALGEWTDVESS